MDYAFLVKPYSCKDIYLCLSQMKPFKAPGLDGFPTGFYQKICVTVKDSIWKFAQNIFVNTILLREVNKTLIVLVPKVLAQ